MWTVHACRAEPALWGQVGLFFRWDILLPVGLLIVVLGFGFWAFMRVRSWRAEMLEEDTSPADQIDHYEKMVEDGLLDPEELARIKARMVQKLMEPDMNHDDPAPPPSPPPDTSIHEKSFRLTAERMLVQPSPQLSSRELGAPSRKTCSVQEHQVESVQISGVPHALRCTRQLGSQPDWSMKEIPSP
jgi:hypothetical protein